MLGSSSRSFSMVNDSDCYLSLQAPKERGAGHVQAVPVLIVEHVGSAKTKLIVCTFRFHYNITGAAEPVRLL